MSTDAKPAETDLVPVPPQRTRRRRWGVAALLVLACAAALWFAPGLISRQLLRRATADLQRGAIGAALEDLQWAASFRGDRGEIELLRAVCFRWRGDQPSFVRSLEAAEEHGIAAERIQQQADLAMIRAGTRPDLDESQLVPYFDQGLPPDDVAASFIQGFLAQQQPQKAESMLSAWAVDSPQSPHLSYVRGIYRSWLGEADQARIEFEQALELSPEHELARMGLAELYEKQERWDLAIDQYDRLAGRCPQHRSARVALGRLLRKSGRIAEARAVLEALGEEPDDTLGLALEMAELELDAGNFAAARKWFDQADLEGVHFTDTLRTAGTAYKLGGNPATADRQFDRADQSRITSLRSQQLQDRIAFDPSDQATVAAFQRIAAEADVATQSPDDDTRGLLPEAAQLYPVYCAPCHGATGRGDGRAARHLFPPPRDLRSHRFRLVSTEDGRPSEQDVLRVLRQGILGTSMRAYDDLTAEQLQSLSRQVMQFQFAGAREQFVAMLQAEGETVDDAEADQYATRKVEAPAELPVPDIPPSDSQSIARGKAAYLEFTCDNCHGDHGSGVDDSPLYNDDGSLATPRDLVCDPMKGGDEPASLFLRLRIGMPGTPHPGCPTATDQQIMDMVHFCQSLSQPRPRHLTGWEQRARANQRALTADFRPAAGAGG